MASRKRKFEKNEFDKNDSKPFEEKKRTGLRSSKIPILFYTNCKLDKGERYFFDSRENEWINQNQIPNFNFSDWSQLFNDESKNCMYTKIEEEQKEDENTRRIEENVEWGSDVERKFSMTDEDKEGNHIVSIQYGNPGGHCFRRVNILSPKGETFKLSECEIDPDLLNTFESTVKDKKLNPPRPSNCTVYSQPKHGSENEKVKNAINDALIDESLKLYPAHQQKVLILDAWYMNTAKRFYKKGVRNITIPNPGECYKMKHDLYTHPEPYDAITIIGTTVGDYLESLSSKKNISRAGFTSIWLDYTSCFTTIDEDGHGQQSDVEILLTKNLLASPSILAISTYTKKRCQRNIDQTEYVLNWFSQLDTNYCFHPVLAGEYAGKSGAITNPGMGIVIFKVEAKGKKSKCKSFPISYMNPHVFTEFILEIKSCNFLITSISTSDTLLNEHLINYFAIFVFNA